jgi:hypothetical protein
MPRVANELTQVQCEACVRTRLGLRFMPTRLGTYVTPMVGPELVEACMAHMDTGAGNETRTKGVHLSALDIAAQSMLDSYVDSANLATVVADRALDHLWDGLFQHVALRVGAERAAELLAELEHQMEREPVAVIDLETGAGPRAELYGRVRSLMPGTAIAESSLPPGSWWTPEDSQYRRTLSDLRRMLLQSLSVAELDVVELRFARSLTGYELAAVLRLDEGAVEQICARALAIAQRHAGRRPANRDHTLEGVLLEVFALDPRHAHAPRRRRRQPVLALGTLIADRYEVEAQLGAGAFADVYRARDREVRDHVVAVKILRVPAADPRSVSAALRELQLIASVFHPSIVQLKDHGWHAHHLWFVMPLYRGETLAQRVARGPLDRQQAREIFEPLAEALATMHRASVLHQDIKPDNVFLATLDTDADTENEEEAKRGPRRILPVLLDLGVAAKDAELVLAGTPAYFAPEVAARFAGAPDPAPVGPKADVFSLALTLRHALDPRPFEDVSGGSVDAFVAYRAAHVPDAPARSHLSDLRAPFARWLAFSPDDRPSADEFRHELSALTAPKERRQRQIALMRWAVPSVVALLTLFAAVVYGLSREASVQRDQAEAARQRADQAGKRVQRVSANLNAQEARRRELEADVARLRTEYQSSRMTREQLASRLAQAEGQIDMLAERQLQQGQRMRMQGDELRSERDDDEVLRTELAAASTRANELQSKLERVTSALDNERSRRAELEDSARQLDERLSAAMRAAREADARFRELRSRWTARLIDPAFVLKKAHEAE